jgi:drug/metabolite transporter (DMT)-like permease
MNTQAALSSQPATMETASRRRSRLILYMMALGTVALWGASFPLTKTALSHAGPSAIAFLRWTISAVFLIGWQAIAGRKQPAQGLSALKKLLVARWRTVTWVALLGITLFYFLENLALRYTTATNAGVLSNLTSVFMVLIGALLLHERLTTIERLALVAAFIGSVLVSQGAGHLSLGGTGLIGDGLMIVATVFGALYSIGGKALSERYPALVVTTAVAVIGALFLLPVALIEGLRFDLPLLTWGAIALLGLGAGALANLWWLNLLAGISASRAALALFLIPLVSAGLSVAFLHEPVTPLLVLGSTLILAGVMTVQGRAA